MFFTLWMTSSAMASDWVREVAWVYQENASQTGFPDPLKSSITGSFAFYQAMLQEIVSIRKTPASLFSSFLGM